ncbi:MAG: hypothetical protein O9302_12350 [Cyclobacteriaceae bacterium]|jgi:hypothetical protein|nr:hypothetical protein [Cytophagales bacterium]MCZ8328847.1 hypothetical protein [Cyclobacteriaceae bacterium]
MKKYSILSTLFAATLLVGCEQELADLKPPVTTTPTGSIGTNINVSNFVTIGNSLVAGYQASALFNEGQDESLGKIINTQFAFAGGTSEFNQPTINSVNGFSGLAGSIPLGRLILFDPDGPGPRGAGPAASGTPARSVTCPSVVETPAVPAPYNSGDPITPFTGDKGKLNNFGVPGIQVGQLLIAATGGPATSNPAYNPFYARFATNPSVNGTTGSTILSDVIARNPTFFLLEIGNNDILGYATGGASNPAIFTSLADFTTRYNGVIATLLGNLPNAKGVIGNIPDITSIPFFSTVRWNAVPLDAATAASLNSGFAGLNQVLSTIQGNAGLMANFGLTSNDLERRKVNYVAGTSNPVLINDETLTNLGPVLDFLAANSLITSQQRTALAPYQQSRPATATDLLVLSAGGVIGTCVGGNAQAINGLSIPLGDNLVLIPSEIAEIQQRTNEFNGVILAAANNSNNRLAHADLNTEFKTFVQNKGATVNGILLTPTITPPYAGFSEDGVHPNGRGYAFLANIFIRAINAKFSSTIPEADITKYRGTRTPVSPQKSF